MLNDKNDCRAPGGNLQACTEMSRSIDVLLFPAARRLNSSTSLWVDVWRSATTLMSKA